MNYLQNEGLLVLLPFVRRQLQQCGIGQSDASFGGTGHNLAGEPTSEGSI